MDNVQIYGNYINTLGARDSVVWLRHSAASQKATDSSHDEVIEFSQFT
jgi:hypothetical protein